MANFNKVFLMGNLTRDPEVSFLPSQMAVCKMGLAINRQWTDKDGQRKEEVTFVDCEAWGRTAENIGKYLKKGRPIFIEGRLKLDQWEAQDGTKRSRMKVVVDTFQFIDSGGRATEAGGDDGGAPQQNYAPRQPSAARPPQRPMGRPAAAPAPQRNYDEDAAPPMPDDDAPPIKEEDIPF